MNQREKEERIQFCIDKLLAELRKRDSPDPLKPAARAFAKKYKDVDKKTAEIEWVRPAYWTLLKKRIIGHYMKEEGDEVILYHRLQTNHVDTGGLAKLAVGEYCD